MEGSLRVVTRRRWFYRLLQAIVRGLLGLFGSLHVEGREHFPKEGPYIVAVNHLHWMDIPVIFVILPHEVATFAAEKWERHWFVGTLLRVFGHAIFVQRGEPDRRAITRAIRWLQAGGVLGIAPEGTRSRTGALQPGKPGTAYLATRTGVPVVPVAIWGQEKFWREVRHFRRPRVYVRIGEPLYLPAAARRAKGPELDLYTEQIMLRIAEMLPEAYRGVYRNKVRGRTPDSNMKTSPALST